MFDALCESCLARDIKVISIDMFDTLIFRNSGEPKDLFRTLAVQAKKRGLLQDDDIDDFISLRVVAEENARKCAYKKTGIREIILKDIYDQIPHFESDVWCKLEIEVEQADWRLNEPLIDILTLAQKNNKKLIVLSDMYLPESALSAYLYINCPEINWIKIWVSGERKKSKVVGDIFPAMLLELNIPAVQVLHVGDNLISDVQMAQSNGLNSFHLKISDYLKEINKLEDVITPFNVKGLQRLRQTLLQRGLATSSSGYYSFGAVIYGPVLITFAHWIVKRCHDHGIKELYCLLREGKIIADVIKILYPDFDVRTLSISRRSSLLPSYKELTTQQLYSLTERRGYCLVELATDIGQILPVHLEAYRHFCLSSLVKESDWELIVNWVEDNQLDIKRYLTEQNYLLKGYLASKGIQNSAHQAILDWGCGGSMFNTISELMSLDNNHYFLFYRKSVEQVLTLKGRLHCFQPQSLHYQSQSLANSPELSEVLLNGNLNSTIYYRQEVDKIISIKSDRLERDNVELAMFKTAVLDCATIARKQNWLIKNVTLKTRERLFTILYRLIDYPLYTEAMLLKNLPIPCFTSSKSILLPDNDIKIIAEKSALTCWDDSLKNTGENEMWWNKGLIALAHPVFLQSQGHFFLQFKGESLPIILLGKLKNRTLSNVVIYGAGELGNKVHHLFKANNIITNFFIDRRAESYTFKVDNLPVYSLKEATIDQEDTIVIASNAFVKEIHREIKNKFPTNKIISI